MEQGETVVVTEDGKPVLDLVPHKKKGGLNFQAIDEFKKKHGITEIFPYIAPDFDDPLPEDFLLRPLNLRLVTLDRALVDHPLAFRAD